MASTLERNAMIPALSWLRPVAVQYRPRERLTQHEHRKDATIPAVKVARQTAQTGGEFGLYRQDALVYLQTGVVVQKFSLCGSIKRDSEPKPHASRRFQVSFR